MYTIQVNKEFKLLLFRAKKIENTAFDTWEMQSNSINGLQHILNKSKKEYSSEKAS